MAEIGGVADIAGMSGVSGASSASGTSGVIGLQAGAGRCLPPARLSVCFTRTELGNQQVRCSQTMLPIHIARLLLLFEGPLAVHDLRQMIDEPWLPEALIELERRRLIRRVMPAMQPTQNLLADAMRARQAPGDHGNHGDHRTGHHVGHSTGDTTLGRRRGRTRMMFLRQLGTLGTEMASRIDQCGSDQELDELMPQVDGLIEAIAGHEALGHFRQHTTRSS